MKRKKKEKTVVRAIRLPERLWVAVSKVAEKELRSAQMQFRKIVEEWLKENSTKKNG